MGLGVGFDGEREGGDSSSGGEMRPRRERRFVCALILLNWQSKGFITGKRRDETRQSRFQVSGRIRLCQVRRLRGVTAHATVLFTRRGFRMGAQEVPFSNETRTQALGGRIQI